MRIKDIHLKNTNKTRTDGKYPQRIGSNVEFYVQPSIDNVMVLSYITDNQGNKKDGILRTSLVKNIVENETEVIITTINSVYYFEKQTKE